MKQSNSVLNEVCIKAVQTLSDYSWRRSCLVLAGPLQIDLFEGSPADQCLSTPLSVRCLFKTKRMTLTLECQHIIRERCRRV